MSMSSTGGASTDPNQSSTGLGTAKSAGNMDTLFSPNSNAGQANTNQLNQFNNNLTPGAVMGGMSLMGMSNSMAPGMDPGLALGLPVEFGGQSAIIRPINQTPQLDYGTGGQIPPGLSNPYATINQPSQQLDYGTGGQIPPGLTNPYANPMPTMNQTQASLTPQNLYNQYATINQAQTQPQVRTNLQPIQRTIPPLLPQAPAQSSPQMTTPSQLGMALAQGLKQQPNLLAPFARTISRAPITQQPTQVKRTTMTPQIAKRIGPQITSPGRNRNLRG